jgi:hypothetical protein
MAISIGGRSVAYAAIVAAAGGFLAVVGAFLDWATTTVSGKTDALNGMDADFLNGRTALVLGAIVLLLVVPWIFNVKLPAIAGRSTIPLLTVAAGVLILAVVVATYMTTLYYPVSLKDNLDAVTKAGGSASLGIGFLLEIVAGILVIVGGELALAKKS